MHQNRSQHVFFAVIVLMIATATPLLAQSAVSIEKLTNGADADTPPGPIVTVGSTVTWTYVVTATGSRDLTGVSVTDDRIGPVTCPATDLAAGTSMTCTAIGVATAGQYSNVGTVSATEVGSPEPIFASDPSHYFGQAGAAISLVKSTNGNDANLPPGPVVAVGATVNWTYLVTNLDGGNGLTGVAVSDDQGVTVNCPQTTLAAGASMTCTASGTAQAGQYANLGSVIATHPTLGLVAASDPSHYFGQSENFDFGDAPDSYGTTFGSNGARHLLGTAVYLGSCVDAEIDGQPSPGSSGDDLNFGIASFGLCTVLGDDEDGVTFTTTLTAGQNASVNVVANAPCTLSAWIDFDSNGSFSSAEEIFPGGIALGGGGNALMFTVPSAAAPGASVARFRCTTDGAVGAVGGANDGEVEDYPVAIITSADLSATKADAPDPVTPGTNLTYTINVTNAGPSNAVSVSLSDTLPANTAFISLAAPAGWTCTTPVVGASGTVSCSIASMPPGAASFSLIVAVSATTVEGSTIVNTASVSATTTDSLPANNIATSTTTVGPAPVDRADLSITKVDAPDPVTPGTNLTYSITVTNSGPNSAANVALTDPLPSNTTFVSLASPAGWTCTTPAVGASGTVSCSTASMPAATNASFSLVVAVHAATAAGTIISNTASIGSATADPIPGNNSATSTTTVGTSQADLSVTKSDAPDPVSNGSQLTYTIAVANAGPSSASAVNLTDALPAQTSFVSLASPAGWTCTTPAAGASGTVSCSTASMPAATNASFSLVVAVNSLTTETSIFNTATVSSASADPTAGNNSATATTLVQAPIPALSPATLALLALLLAALGVVAVSRLSL